MHEKDSSFLHIPIKLTASDTQFKDIFSRIVCRFIGNCTWRVKIIITWSSLGIHEERESIDSRGWRQQCIFFHAFSSWNPSHRPISPDHMLGGDWERGGSERGRKRRLLELHFPLRWRVSPSSLCWEGSWNNGGSERRKCIRSSTTSGSGGSRCRGNRWCGVQPIWPAPRPSVLYPLYPIVAWVFSTRLFSVFSYF